MGKRRAWQPVLFGDVAFIPLTQDKWTVIDTTDLHMVTNRTWNAVFQGRSWYARSVHSEYLHRVLLGVDGPDDVDHIDRNGLNNRRSNLREASRTQNLGNQRKGMGTSSRYKGVTRPSGKVKWQARIGFRGERMYLGTFTNEEDAALAYDAAARTAFGEFARLNFPDL